MLKQAWRMTWRDWRAGELRFLVLALVVAIAALSSVGFFVDRLRGALERDSHQLLGADLVVAGDRSLPVEWRSRAQLLGLATADTVTFPSMALAGDGDDASSQLVALKAVSEGYPLRGKLKLKTPSGEAPANRTPATGMVWADAAVLDTLGVKTSGTLRLGDREFRIEEVIAMEPDRGASFMNFAPRVMISLADLPATNLIQDGSRVTYRLLAAGDKQQVDAFRKFIGQQVKEAGLRGIRVESLEAGRPEMRATLDRAERFLSLVSLLAAMLAAVAVALAARRFMLRHLDACAMLRCLGLKQSQVTAMYLIEFLLIGLAGSALGVAIGYLSHFALLHLLGSLIGGDLPLPSVYPALQGIAAGVLLLTGFALPPVLQLRDVPHNHVIRREQLPPKPFTVATYLLGASVFVLLLLSRSGDVKLALLTAGGFIGGLGVFALVGWAALKGIRRLRALSAAPSWRFALDAMRRRPGATLVQVVAVALGLMALLLLTIIRAELVSAWKQSVPPDAPNRFMINIQPDQTADIEKRLVSLGVEKPVLYPMIRGRLIAVNETKVTASTYTDDRAQRLVEREFNLSTMGTLPYGNRIVSGKWFGDQGNEASVEEGLAKTLKLKLGDRLHFSVAGQSVEATVNSIRKLDWGSMRVNFFVILSPAAAAGLPATWITAFHLPDSQAAAAGGLVREFPNLTIVDTGAVIRQVQGVIDQVVIAVEFLFLFALMSGVLVLYAAIASSQEERMREAGILRALGATQGQLSRAQAVELACVGILAGLLASLGAALTGWLLATRVFDFAWSWSSPIWIAGPVAGVVCAYAAGWIALRSILRQPPMLVLRQA